MPKKKRVKKTVKSEVKQPDDFWDYIEERKSENIEKADSSEKDIRLSEILLNRLDTDCPKCFEKCGEKETLFYINDWHIFICGHCYTRYRIFGQTFDDIYAQREAECKIKEDSEESGDDFNGEFQD